MLLIRSSLSVKVLSQRAVRTSRLAYNARANKECKSIYGVIIAETQFADVKIK